jgi:hypothetical protein
LEVIIKISVVILLTKILFCIVLWLSRYIYLKKVKLGVLGVKYEHSFVCYMCNLLLTH